MATKLPIERVAFSPGEFAALFGKSQTWGYRQIYAGKVKAITKHGRILIPAAEVDVILRTAGVYDGLKSKPAKTKAEIQSFTPNLQNAWQSFLKAKRSALVTESQHRAVPRRLEWSSSASQRANAYARLGKRRER